MTHLKETDKSVETIVRNERPQITFAMSDAMRSIRR